MLSRYMRISLLLKVENQSLKVKVAKMERRPSQLTMAHLRMSSWTFNSISLSQKLLESLRCNFIESLAWVPIWPFH